MRQGFLRFVIPLLAFALSFAPSLAHAGYFEISGGFFYTKSTYSDTDYNWTRRWGANAGYHLTDTSEIEFTFQDVTDRTVIAGFEDTQFHDQIYGLDWNQSLTPKGTPIQPYFKAGIGQLNRTASGSYSGGVSPPAELDQVTGILGGGLRIYITRNIGLRGEVVSYITTGGIATWKDNINTTVGVSVYF